MSASRPPEHDSARVRLRTGASVSPISDALGWKDNRRPIGLQRRRRLLFAAAVHRAHALFLLLSFWQVEFFELLREFTTQNYRRCRDRYLNTLGYTALLATATALLTTALGFLFSFIARFRAGDWAQTLLFIVLITLFGGYLMKIYAWKTILGNEGVLNTALIGLGIISSRSRASLQPAGRRRHAPPFQPALRGSADLCRRCAASRTAEIEVARDLGAGGWKILDRHRAALPCRHRHRLQLLLPDHRRRLCHARCSSAASRP